MTAKKPKPRKTPRQRVEFLLQHRRRISETSWNAIAPMFGDTILVERDADLMAAIEAWRLRELAAIDEALRELGITDPDALQDDLEKLAEDHRTARLEMIEAAMHGKRPEYRMYILGGCSN